ncbi:MAG: adenine deaminase C-terminal domain-containing protein [Methanotrichaceae archaeon]
MIGVSSEDMLVAARSIEKMNSGLVVVENCEIEASLSVRFCGFIYKRS